jgi:hypothetical protein
MKMLKLKLDLAALTVESFDSVAPSGGRGPGTVLGRSELETEPRTDLTDCDLNECANWTAGDDLHCLTGLRGPVGCTYLQDSCINNCDPTETLPGNG